MSMEPCGPLERAWRDCGLPVVALPRLYHPRLLLRHDGPPCAFLPAGAAGPGREVFFAWLIVELACGHADWSPLATRLPARGRARP